jgi:four helix bundle protein
MSNIRSYQDLEAWKQAMELALLVYSITDKYPRYELFTLTAHTRKSAVAVPSNIAEGTRRTKAGYIARLIDALAEHAETETQVILATRRGYGRESDSENFARLSATVGRLTHGLLRSLDGNA